MMDAWFGELGWIQMMVHVFLDPSINHLFMHLFMMNFNSVHFLFCHLYFTHSLDNYILIFIVNIKVNPINVRLLHLLYLKHIFFSFQKAKLIFLINFLNILHSINNLFTNLIHLFFTYGWLMDGLDYIFHIWWID